MFKYKRVLTVPNNFFIGDTFKINEDEHRAFFKDFIGYIDECNFVFTEKVNIDLTIRMHSGDCRIWYMDGGYNVLSGNQFIMNCEKDYETILEWMEDFMPEAYHRLILILNK